MTKVINIKNAPDGWRSNGSYVYIGRPSIWGNPFNVATYGRNGCLVKYREYIMEQPTLLKSLYLLKDKILVCYCKPLACHGDILVELIEKMS